MSTAPTTPTTPTTTLFGGSSGGSSGGPFGGFTAPVSTLGARLRRKSVGAQTQRGNEITSFITTTIETNMDKLVRQEYITFYYTQLTKYTFSISSYGRTEYLGTGTCPIALIMKDFADKQNLTLVHKPSEGASFSGTTKRDAYTFTW